jgi:hypothetical protein
MFSACRDDVGRNVSSIVTHYKQIIISLFERSSRLVSGSISGEVEMINTLIRMARAAGLLLALTTAAAADEPLKIATSLTALSQGFNRDPCLFRDLELDWSARFLLNDCCSIPHLGA